MKHFLTLLFFIIFIDISLSQISDGNPVDIDSLSNDEITVKLSGKTKYTDYKIISLKKDTTIVDTTLTIQKYYKFNYRRKDNFELLDFHNQGQTFTNLAYDFSNTSVFPDIGFRGKQFLYIDADEIKYYEVPTPTSEVMARTGLQQGQVLDALFTTNFSKRFNISLAYKGLRSLGQYRESLSSTGNFRATLSYRNPNERYEVRFHLTSQDFTNQESGGLTDEMIIAFEDNLEDYFNRDVMDVKLNDTESFFKGTRTYIDQNYKLFSRKDSTNQKDFTNLKVGHVFHREKKRFQLTQNNAFSEVFGESFANSIDEGTTHELMNNQGYLEFNSKYILGRFKVKANYTSTEYGYDSIYNPNISDGKLKLKSRAGSLGGEWKAKLGNFHVNADANVAPGSSYLSGNYFKGEAFYEKDSVFTLKGRLLISSKSANFNFLFMNSNYDNYNWDNDFDNINTQNIGFDLNSKWGNASVDFTNISNYTYFNETAQPLQFGEALTYLKLKVNNEFKVGKFALNNTVMYQSVSSGSSVFRVPDFTTRNTLYYTDSWFKGDPLYIQIGMNFKYFTKYYMNSYNPILGEFHIQNEKEIGYPMVDAFVNARIRRTRLFLQADNVFTGLLGRNYYSAPGYPYRDFVIRFGVVWNWFI